MYICIVFGDKNVYKKEFVQVDLYMVPVLFRSVCHHYKSQLLQQKRK